MPGFKPTPVANNVRNGNSVAAMIGDQIMYFAQTVGHQYPFGAEQLYGIGTAKPQEVQQLRMSPQITLDSFDLTVQGVNLLQGGVTLPYVLAGQVYDFHIYDGETNTVLFTYIGCKAGNYAGSVPANAPLRDTYSFLAMDVLDAQGNSVLDTGENAIDIASAIASVGLAAAGQLGAGPPVTG